MSHLERKVNAFVVLMSLCSASTAGLISEGYTLDSQKNIVTGKGLEWLRWDVTLGMTADSALSLYSLEGWSLASNAQISQLFNDADLGLIFDADETTFNDVGVAWDVNEATPYNEFINLMGDTYSGGNRYDSTDPLQLSKAFYGEDSDGDGLYNLAAVSDDYVGPNSRKIGSWAQLWPDLYETKYSYLNTGVALVRAQVDVPEPSGMALFIAGMLSMFFFCRKEHSR